MADAANEFKDEGNKAFAAKDYDKAINLFTQGLALDPTNHVLYASLHPIQLLLMLTSTTI